MKSGKSTVVKNRQPWNVNKCHMRFLPIFFCFCLIHTPLIIVSTCPLWLLSLCHLCFDVLSYHSCFFFCVLWFHCLVVILWYSGIYWFWPLSTCLVLRMGFTHLLWLPVLCLLPWYLPMMCGKPQIRPSTASGSTRTQIYMLLH